MRTAPPIWRSDEESDESAVFARKAAVSQKKKEAELAAGRNLPKKVVAGKFRTCPLEFFRKMQQNRKTLGMQPVTIASGAKTEAEFAALSCVNCA